MKTANLNFTESKTVITFLDKDRKKAVVTVYLEGRNGYPEASFTAEYARTYGQCFDDIKPRTPNQRTLIIMWRKYHLKKVDPVKFTATITALAAGIKKTEDKRKGNNFEDLEDWELIEYVQENTDFQNKRDAELCVALIRMFDLSADDLQDIEIDGTRCTVQGMDYTAGDDKEMNEEWEQDLDNYLAECVLPDLPENAQCYFDREQWKADARRNGRNHSLGRYDGNELEYKYEETYYFAYRQ